MPVVTVRGKASKTILKSFSFDKNEGTISFLEILRNEDIPVASSCFGEGICKKCVLEINGENKLSCEVFPHKDKQMSYDISIDYL